MSLRSHSIPCASIFAHCAAVRRIERCSSFASGGAGGLPRGRFVSSMQRLSVIHQTLANRHLLNHNKHNINQPTESEMASSWRIVQADGTPFRFHVIRHNASIVEYLSTHWERDAKGHSLFRSEADALAAIAKTTGSAA